MFPDPQPVHFLPAHAVIEQGGQDGPIPHALERVRFQRLQQLARLSVTQRRRMLASLPFAIGRFTPPTGIA